MTTFAAPQRLLPESAQFPAALRLIRNSFAGMEGRISPPSSVHRMSLADLQAPHVEVWTIGITPDACMVLTPQPQTLYLGKLAVAQALRGRGLSRSLIAKAQLRARELGRPTVTLQTRVELLENQAIFTRLGFQETCRSAHAGYDRPTSITYTIPLA